MVTLWFGYEKDFMKNNSRNDILMWLQALVIITILLSVIGALRSTLKFLRIVLKL